MFYRYIGNLKRVTCKPYLNIIISVILLGTGISETIDDLKSLESFTLGVHHGVVVFASMHILKIFPDIFEGLEYAGKLEAKE